MTFPARPALVALLVAAGCAAAPVASTPTIARAPAVAANALACLSASADIDGLLIGEATNATLVIVFASWCEHCHDALAHIDALRARHPSLRILGVNYRGHEEYDHLGNAAAVRTFVSNHAPWLRVVPADDELFAALGKPSKIPTMFIYDRNGAMVEGFDRSVRETPSIDELEATIRRAGE